MPSNRPKRILIIAGSDSGGGAGIQADIKTATALGAFATTAVTAVTAQNSLGVTAVHAVPAETVKAQIEAVLSDIGTDAVKIGMLGTRENVDAVAHMLSQYAAKALPVVIDPVSVASSGDRLLDADAFDSLKYELLPFATVLTPNLPEAAALLGRPVDALEERKEAALDLLAMGSHAVLLTGGHSVGPRIQDILATEDSLDILESDRINSPHTHGTGCTLSTALAVFLAEGKPMAEAALKAGAYVHEAIRSAPGFGRGHGPLNHLHPLK